MDGSFWFLGRWYIIPEETAAGRQPHNLKRELYRTNDVSNIEVIHSILFNGFSLLICCLTLVNWVLLSMKSFLPHAIYVSMNHSKVFIFPFYTMKDMNIITASVSN